MAGKKGLGRGFDALIPTDVLDETFDVTSEQDEKTSELRYLKLTDIEPNPDQPRKDFDKDALAELAASIKEHGVVQPIVVTPGKNGFAIVAGERRWRAAKQAGLRKIPVIVRTMSAQHKLELALIENLMREDLNPLEIGMSYLKLMNQFNMSTMQIGKRLGRSHSAISNHVRLLKLPDFIKDALAAGDITEGHARQFLVIANDEAAQKFVLERIKKDGWSVRKTEAYVIGYRQEAGSDSEVKRKRAARLSTQETDFTKYLSKRISVPVKNRVSGQGSGQIIIPYKTHEELARIEEILSKS